MTIPTPLQAITASLALTSMVNARSNMPAELPDQALSNNGLEAGAPEDSRYTPISREEYRLESDKPSSAQDLATQPLSDERLMTSRKSRSRSSSGSSKNKYNVFVAEFTDPECLEKPTLSVIRDATGDKLFSIGECATRGIWQAIRNSLDLKQELPDRQVNPIGVTQFNDTIYSVELDDTTPVLGIGDTLEDKRAFIVNKESCNQGVSQECVLGKTTGSISAYAIGGLSMPAAEYCDINTPSTPAEIEMCDFQDEQEDKKDARKNLYIGLGVAAAAAVAACGLGLGAYTCYEQSRKQKNENGIEMPGFAR